MTVAVGACDPAAAARLVDLWSRRRDQFAPGAVLHLESSGGFDAATFGDPLAVALPAAQLSAGSPLPFALAVVEHLTAEASARLVAFAAAQTAGGAPGAVVVLDTAEVAWVPLSEVGDGSPDALRAAVAARPDPAVISPAVSEELDTAFWGGGRAVTLLCSQRRARTLWDAWGGTADGWDATDFSTPDWAREDMPMFRAGRVCVAPLTGDLIDVDWVNVAWRSGPKSRAFNRVVERFVPDAADVDEALYHQLRVDRLSPGDATAAARAL